MIRSDPPPPIPTEADPTVFGLSPTQLHDRFWAARGVQVVRLGEASEIVEAAELFLLTDPRTLAIFKLRSLLDTLNWVEPDILFVRIHDEKQHDYREHAVTDEANQFVRFERVYGGDSRLARVALTSDLGLAKLWQEGTVPRDGWRRLRRTVPHSGRVTGSVRGWVYDRTDLNERVGFVQDLVGVWRRPDATIRRAGRAEGGAWADPASAVASDARVVGPVWIGAGRKVDAATPIVGPAALWDDPHQKPEPDQLQWLEIERTRTFERPVRVRRRSRLERWTKRAFDIAFSLSVLTVTAPIYPLVMLAIWLEDGRPFFFGHRRETLGGREFPCLKFRSMRKDAEQIKGQLVGQNQSDGPQFFMEHDPRLTRVGAIIRKLNIDELPQFINVLLGHMSIVGPRPSPRKENQYCPGWREARLSVRPGITGLWQVRRSRLQGLDFQEWIRYDIEYVEHGNWSTDLWIIGQTVKLLVNGLVSARF